MRISLGDRVAGGPAAAATTTPALSLAFDADLPTATPTASPSPVPSETTPAPVSVDTPVPSEPVRHKVKAGETLIQIAAKYESSVKDIANANDMAANGVLRIGQELLIPVAGPSGGPGPTATSAGGALMYVVQSGDTLIGIADRYGSRLEWILRANGMQAGEVLHIGKALLVPLAETTPTATLTSAPSATPTPTAGPRLQAPILLAPADGATVDTVSGEDAILLTWAAVPGLTADDWYVVLLEAVEVDRPIPLYWTQATSWRLPAEHRADGNTPTEFTWQVQVRAGGPDGPGKAASPPSASRRFTWR